MGDAVRLTLMLATCSTLVLLVVATPLAWWLASTRSRLRPVVEALVVLPLVLPATVLGFYLLVLLSPDAPIGAAVLRLTGETLTFSFSGLLIASCVHSLPFAVAPLQAAFASVGVGVMEAAATLGARPRDAFATVAAPLAVRGFLASGVLTFAHSLGEFGVVLMVGGNIPGRTRTVAVEIYQAVETLDYRTAHLLSAGLLALTLLVLLPIQVAGRAPRGRHG